MDHKVRLMYKGWPPSVSVGYRMPRAARGIHPSGFKEVLVHNVDELVAIDAEIQVVRIAHTIGKRKRGTILAEARKKGITVLNIKQVREEVKKTETKKEQPEKPETAEKAIGEEEKESKEPLESTEKKPQGRRRRTKKTEKEQE